MDRKHLQQGGSIDEDGFRSAVERLKLLAQIDDSGEPDPLEEIENVDAEVRRNDPTRVSRE